MQTDEANSRPQRQIFDAEEYASLRLREGKQLSDIRQELGGQLQDLRDELHSLINMRYEDFLGLSTSLTGIDATINAVKAPLSSLSGEIANVGDSFASKLEYLDKRLAYRSVIRENKQMLRLFIDLSRLLDRVSAILKEAKALKEDGETLEYVKCLERAAVDLSQIRYFVGKGGELPFVVQAAKRTAEIEKDLKLALYMFLVRCIDEHAESSKEGRGSSSSENMVLIAQCLRAYSTIDECAEAESIIRNRLVKPFAYRTFAEQPGKGMGIDPLVFSSMLEKTLEFLARVAAPLATGIEAYLPASSYNLETRVFWREIAETIVATLPLLFVPGMPDRFHKNYLAACKFMREFGGLFDAAGKAALEMGGSLAKEESFVEFNRKWQLSAYFSIRKTQITDAIDGTEQQQKTGNGRALSPPSLSGRPSTPVSVTNRAMSASPEGPRNHSTSPEFQISQEAVDLLLEELGMCTRNAALAMWAIRRCWAPDVYLEPLAYRFWQLTVQVTLWYRSAADADIRRLILDDSSGANGAGSTGEGRSGTERILENIHDVFVLKQHVLDQVDGIYHLLPIQQPTTSADSPSIQSDIAESLKSSIVLAFAALETTASGALDYMCTTIVSTSCANIASQLRRTTSQFRHTNRAAPTTASAYVGRLFSSLAAAEEKIDKLQEMSRELGDDFAQKTKSAMREGVCRGISLEVARASAEALATISKTEASLQRLRKTRDYSKVDHLADDLPVPVGVDLRGKVPATDNEKIRRQIWLDIVELGRIVGEYRARPHEEYTKLARLAAPLGT
ncbi:COG2-domain-containing protein [Martensiomyces pterosporus]|nr:COG2-domain-containing protein [Martensiomyces pterosporus]